MTVTSPGMTNPMKSAVSAAARRNTAPIASGAGIDRKAWSNLSSMSVARPGTSSPRRLPAVVRGVTFPDRNERAAAGRRDLAARLERGLDDRAVLGGLDDARPERDRSVARG